MRTFEPKIHEAELGEEADEAVVKAAENRDIAKVVEAELDDA
ncbi:MAG: hypothetical protein U9N80_10435 [Chloroflexota bacterium]|nr:hypothetical protein [Chloroflexota bacterium]